MTAWFDEPFTDTSLILGRSLPVGPRLTSSPMSGQAGAFPRPQPLFGDQLLGVANNGHCLTLAPAGMNVANCVLIPNLLNYAGSIVVTDPRGELYASTARFRHEMKQTVLRLDPFGVSGGESDAINLSYLIHFDGADFFTQCQKSAELINPRVSMNDHMENCAFAMVSAVIGYIDVVPEKRFSDVFTTFRSDDVVYNMAVVLDTIGRRLSQESYSEIGLFLSREDQERSRIISAINSRHSAFVNKAVRDTLDGATNHLSKIADGEQFTVYLMIPADKLRSHFPVLRLWIGALLHAFARRPASNTGPTGLFMLPEIQFAECFPALEAAFFEARAAAPRIWTLWNDLSQLRSVFPLDWPVILQKCPIIQYFSAKDYLTSTETADLFGLDLNDLITMHRDEVLLRVDDQWHLAQSCDYRVDPEFVGRFDVQNK